MTLLALPSDVTAAPSEEDSCRDAIPVLTYDVNLKPDKATYRPGSVVSIEVTVTRPPRDPAGVGDGIDPPVIMPAPGASVIVYLKVAGLEYAEFGQTNEQGKVVLGIKLPSPAPEGPVPAVGYAYRTLARLPCVDVEEFGLVTDPAFVTVGN
ncbi:MAG TPA: hypothetical protein VG602_03840 [Actinomycetota bacterium]|nr:hypothetical protein [Actinomycetota bacterium]